MLNLRKPGYRFIVCYESYLTETEIMPKNPVKASIFLPAVQSVPRESISSLTSQQFFEQYQKPGKPVIITDSLNAEPAWTLKYLAQKLNHLTFPIRHYGRERYEQDKRQWTSTGSGVAARLMTFEQYAELLQSGEAYAQDLYLARCSLSNTPLANAPAIRAAEQQLGLKMPATDLNLWVGPAGHTSCLHYDPMDGTLTQLCGAKKVILFPPHQLYNLYPFSVVNHLLYGLKLRAVYSQVYPEHPDFNAFPKFEKALRHRYEVVLQQGETLFIPAGWWHEVTSIGDRAVSSVNRFWHVLPWSRTLRSWSKWRAHLGGVYAAPHVVWGWLSAVCSSDRTVKLRELVQRL